MQKVSRLIDDSARKYKINDKVHMYKAISLWESVVAKILPEAAQKTMVVAVEKGVLRIAVLSREIGEQIMALQKRILYELNERIGKILLYRVSCEY